jgi:hypothetical protein
MVNDPTLLLPAQPLIKNESKVYVKNACDYGRSTLDSCDAKPTGSPLYFDRFFPFAAHDHPWNCGDGITVTLHFTPPSSTKHGRNLINQHRCTEAAPPRVDAAQDLVDRPNDERGPDQTFQVVADPTRWMPGPEQDTADKENPQRGVRHLPDGDGAGLAVLKKPMQKSTHRTTRVRSTR